ncbi:transposase [Bradyrhizobium sp. CCGUVB1N3]|uniref:IS66-like element accessory protein TnpA n=1 Tax=Bradyrhizobium sp. CCGUVB1N3 TaxID=2949629 RepID=UPI003531B2B4
MISAPPAGPCSSSSVRAMRTLPRSRLSVPQAGRAICASDKLSWSQIGWAKLLASTDVAKLHRYRDMRWLGNVGRGWHAVDHFGVSADAFFLHVVFIFRWSELALRSIDMRPLNSVEHVEQASASERRSVTRYPCAEGPCLIDASAADPRGNPRGSAMTISRAEVITSIERRRRWSQDEKERLVAASLEPGTTVSEVARMAGLHVSQLFRWRKELCHHGDTSIARLVPVEIGPSVPPRDVAEAPMTTAPAHRRSSQGIIEIDLGSGHRIRVDGDVDGDALRRVLDALVRR